jgi:hypothetical protein
MGSEPEGEPEQRKVPLRMKYIMRLRPVLVILLVGLYCAMLARSFSEGERRSLQLRADTDTGDHVDISALVTGVNPAAQQLTAQITLLPEGALALDNLTPAVDLKLLTNNMRGQVEYSFPKGERMNRIEAVFPMEGEINRYPFDRYRTTLWLLVTTPAGNAQQQNPASTEIIEDKSNSPQAGRLRIGTAALQRGAAIPLTIHLFASTPGIKFGGTVSRQPARKVTGIELRMRRADNVIAVSILLIVLMGGLSLSMLAMALRVITSKSMVNLVPFSISVSLIFGLPAIRNVQPGVPAVGAFVDYVAFLWAEIIVGVSGIIIAWTWMLRSQDE